MSTNKTKTVWLSNKLIATSSADCTKENLRTNQEVNKLWPDFYASFDKTVLEGMNLKSATLVKELSFALPELYAPGEVMPGSVARLLIDRILNDYPSPSLD